MNEREQIEKLAKERYPDREDEADYRYNDIQGWLRGAYQNGAKAAFAMRDEREGKLLAEAWSKISFLERRVARFKGALEYINDYEIDAKTAYLEASRALAEHRKEVGEV